MVGSKIARRYAKSLLLLAKERGELETVFKEMEIIRKTTQQNKDLRVLFRSPVVPKDKKLKIFLSIFGEETSAMVKGFFTIITKNNREHLTEGIAVSFGDLYRENNKILTAKVTTAVEMDADFSEKMKALVSKLEHNSIEIHEEVNADIVGGLVVRVGDMQIDMSVARQLRDIKRELVREDYKVKM
ncbi:MAG: ATP synthase F1 subunit delta [Flavobacteriales bacterium]|nr:ATP synthase F1 subunit delta [Flavobacteriales bacterium]